jgi:glycosyltransferase involved in cell wall biosynthesis
MSLRVVQIIDNLTIGGAQRLLITLASQAQAHSLEVSIVSLGSNNDRIILDELFKLGTKVIIFPAKHLFDLRRIFRLARFLSGSEFDLVQCHLTYANIIGTLCGRLAGLQVITTLHSTGGVLPVFHPLIEAIESWVARLLAKRVIAVGYTVADKYQAHLRRSIDVIPNAVSMAERITKEERLAIRREIVGEIQGPITISVGRFAPPKGFEDLILAVSILSSSCPNLKLILVGDGPLFERIRNLIAELNLKDRVILLGARGDVPRLLAASDLYVCSSHWEGAPLAIMEAMMAGLPIVATGVGDIPRMVMPDIGLVVPPHQPHLLAEAMGKLLNEPAKLIQMGAAAQTRAIRNYSPRVWMEGVLDIYTQALPLKSG